MDIPSSTIQDPEILQLLNKLNSYYKKFRALSFFNYIFSLCLFFNFKLPIQAHTKVVIDYHIAVLAFFTQLHSYNEKNIDKLWNQMQSEEHIFDLYCKLFIFIFGLHNIKSIKLQQYRNDFLQKKELLIHKKENTKEIYDYIIKEMFVNVDEINELQLNNDDKDNYKLINFDFISSCIDYGIIVFTNPLSTFCYSLKNAICTNFLICINFIFHTKYKLDNINKAIKMKNNSEISNEKQNGNKKIHFSLFCAYFHFLRNYIKLGINSCNKKTKIIYNNHIKANFSSIKSSIHINIQTYWNYIKYIIFQMKAMSLDDMVNVTKEKIIDIYTKLPQNNNSSQIEDKYQQLVH